MSVTFADLGVPADLVAALAATRHHPALRRPGRGDPRRDRRPRRLRSRPDRLRARRSPSAFRCSAVSPGPQKRKPTALILAPTRELAAQICRELEPLAGSRAPPGLLGLRRRRLRGPAPPAEPRRRRPRCLPRPAGRSRSSRARCRSTTSKSSSSTKPIACPTWDSFPTCGACSTARPKTRQTLLFSATLDGEVAVLDARLPAQSGPSRLGRGGARRPGRAPRVLVGGRPEAPRGHGRTRAVSQARRSCSAGPDAAPTGSPSSSRATACGPTRCTAGDRRTSATARSPTSRRARSTRSIATDVAARGIHVDGVACVVHFDTAEDEKAYLHRSGRTARAGAAGVVVSLRPACRSACGRTYAAHPRHPGPADAGRSREPRRGRRAAPGPRRARRAPRARRSRSRCAEAGASRPAAPPGFRRGIARRGGQHRGAEGARRRRAS